MLAQIVAQRLGLEPEQITVNLELDTQKDGWSIAAGNYACRFGPICSTVADMAAVKVRDKLARIAATRLNVRPDELEFGGGRIFARENPDNAVSFHRIAGEAHWSPATLPPDLTPGLRETVQWSPPQLTATTEDNQINSMAVYGFGFDYCGVEIDPDTGEIRIDKYVTIHDCGPLLNPGIAEGQIGGSFAYGLNTALYEEFVYGEDGSFLSGTFADYLVGTAHEIPRFLSLHPSAVTPSPWTAFGAKGVSEGNATSTPVCIANAVADALARSDIRLPLRPSRVAEWIHEAEQPPRKSPAPRRAGRLALTGSGSAIVPETRERVFHMLLDPALLTANHPGMPRAQRRGRKRIPCRCLAWRWAGTRALRGQCAAERIVASARGNTGGPRHRPARRGERRWTHPAVGGAGRNARRLRLRDRDFGENRLDRRPHARRSCTRGHRLVLPAIDHGNRPCRAAVVVALAPEPIGLKAAVTSKRGDTHASGGPGDRLVPDIGADHGGHALDLLGRAARDALADIEHMHAIGKIGHQLQVVLDPQN